jgi:ABC-2 type transport system permease protein
VSPFLALVRKHVHESRWTLAFSAGALFGLGWLSVYITSLRETRIVQALGSVGDDERVEWMRRLGLAKEPSSAEITMAFWNHPIFIILIAIWGVSRGTAAVAAEVERGTMDLLLSRPVSRTTYLASQLVVTLAGLAILAAALALGGSWAVSHNVLRSTPASGVLIKPAVNLAALGLPIYGYTLLASSLDTVRWRPTWIGSSLTLAGFIAFVVVMNPVFAEASWKPWVEAFTIFRAYRPVELVGAGETFAANLAFLAEVAAPCIVLAFIALAWRDLPANG